MYLSKTELLETGRHSNMTNNLQRKRVQAFISQFL